MIKQLSKLCTIASGIAHDVYGVLLRGGGSSKMNHHDSSRPLTPSTSKNETKAKILSKIVFIGFIFLHD